jgi:hypothetical protein
LGFRGNLTQRNHLGCSAKWGGPPRLHITKKCCPSMQQTGLGGSDLVSTVTILQQTIDPFHRKQAAWTACEAFDA